jgi:hypothetical protein
MLLSALIVQMEPKDPRTADEEGPKDIVQKGDWNKHDTIVQTGGKMQTHYL